MSMPCSAMAATAAALSCSVGSEPPEKTSTRSPARWRDPPGRHLRAAGVVDAQEQDARVEIGAVRLEADQGAQPILGQALDEHRQPGRDPRLRQQGLERLSHQTLDGLDVELPLPATLKRDRRTPDLEVLGGRRGLAGRRGHARAVSFGWVARSAAEASRSTRSAISVKAERKAVRVPLLTGSGTDQWRVGAANGRPAS